MANLRDNGGYDKYAMKIPENYIYENREKISGTDLIKMQEIETAVYFSNRYGEDPVVWLKEARRVLNEFY